MTTTPTTHALRAGTLNCTVLASADDHVRPARGDRRSVARPVALVATATSGLPVSFSASGPCSVSGTAAAPTLTVSRRRDLHGDRQPGGQRDFAPATPVVRTVTITQAPTSLRQRPVSLLGSLFGMRSATRPS